MRKASLSAVIIWRPENTITRPPMASVLVRVEKRPQRVWLEVHSRGSRVGYLLISISGLQKSLRPSEQIFISLIESSKGTKKEKKKGQSRNG